MTRFHSPLHPSIQNLQLKKARKSEKSTMLVLRKKRRESR